MKKHCVSAVGLLVVVLFCLPVGFRGYTHADSLQEKFILLITNTEADNVVAYFPVFWEIPWGFHIDRYRRAGQSRHHGHRPGWPFVYLQWDYSHKFRNSAL